MSGGKENYVAQRIALYLPSLCGGGAERVMVTLANGFSARGYAVDLVLASADGPYLKDVAMEVRVVDLRASRVALSLPGLVSYLRRERPVSMLSAMGHANVIAIAAQYLARVPTRVIVSERANFSRTKSHITSFSHLILGWFMKIAYPLANGIVAVSTGVAEDLVMSIGLTRSHVDVVYNPVVTDELYRKASMNLYHPWLAPGQPPVVLGAGRLEPQKDFATLIEAFAKLRRERDVRLMILGEGALRNSLEKQVQALGLEASVCFLGFMDNPFVYMRHAALFVLSSIYEGLPNALIQAMACGTPVVSTDCPSGPAEILEDGKWGRLVPVRDANALAYAMTATLDEKVHPEVATRAAEFNVERAVDGYLKLLVPHSASNEKKHSKQRIGANL